MSNDYSVNNRQNWMFGNLSFDINKDDMIFNYIREMYVRTSKMFEYEGLPDTIPKKYLELYLQKNGYVGIIKVNDKLYAQWGTLGGKCDAYYLPQEFICTNPWLKGLKKSYYERDVDCVIGANDSLYMGISNINLKWAKLLAENDISFKFGLINTRVNQLVSADNDTARISAEDYFKDISEGKKLGIIKGKPFFDNLKTYEYGRSTMSPLKDLIETRQYFMSQWYIDLCLNGNYNMKRESLSENELKSDDDILQPFIDDMLEARQEMCNKVNQMFGTEWKVKLSSSWKKIKEEIDLELEQKKEEVEDTNKEVDENVDITKIEGND